MVSIYSLDVNTTIIPLIDNDTSLVDTQSHLYHVGRQTHLPVNMADCWLKSFEHCTVVMLDDESTE